MVWYLRFMEPEINDAVSSVQSPHIAYGAKTGASWFGVWKSRLETKPVPLFTTLVPSTGIPAPLLHLLDACVEIPTLGGCMLCTSQLFCRLSQVQRCLTKVLRNT